MPELPEVETIKIGLEKKILGKEIAQVFCSDKNLRIASNLDLKELVGCKVSSISRRARYLVLQINDEKSLVIHLGMSGRLVFADFKSESEMGQTRGSAPNVGVDPRIHPLKNPTISSIKPNKHDHFICIFDDKSQLTFNDPRRFGFVDLTPSKNLTKHKFLAKLGPEPFDDSFDAKYLTQALKKKSQNIKTTMMDNQIVVGVGNIYINEALFAAKISPLRAANSLTTKEIATLVEVIKSTLKTAIESGGSSINDYVDSNGNLGNFQNNFKIYGLEKNNCVKCKNEIQRIVQNGRSTFYCKQCQI